MIGNNIGVHIGDFYFQREDSYWRNHFRGLSTPRIHLHVCTCYTVIAHLSKLGNFPTQAQWLDWSLNRGLWLSISQSSIYCSSDWRRKVNWTFWYQTWVDRGWLGQKMLPKASLGPLGCPFRLYNRLVNTVAVVEILRNLLLFTSFTSQNKPKMAKLRMLHIFQLPLI